MGGKGVIGGWVVGGRAYFGILAVGGLQWVL